MLACNLPQRLAAAAAAAAVLLPLSCPALFPGREGLDWLLHEAGLRGLRVILVLTNGASSAGGGMKQYIDWVDPALTVTDFYTNDTVKVGAGRLAGRTGKCHALGRIHSLEV